MLEAMTNAEIRMLGVVIEIARDRQFPIPADVTTFDAFCAHVAEVLVNQFDLTACDYINANVVEYVWNAEYERLKPKNRTIIVNGTNKITGELEFERTIDINHLQHLIWCVNKCAMKGLSIDLNYKPTYDSDIL